MRKRTFVGKNTFPNIGNQFCELALVIENRYKWTTFTSRRNNQ